MASTKARLLKHDFPVHGFLGGWQQIYVENIYALFLSLSYEGHSHGRIARDATLLLTTGSFLLTFRLLCLQLRLGDYLLAVGACLLTIATYLITVGAYFPYSGKLHRSTHRDCKRKKLSRNQKNVQL